MTCHKHHSQGLSGLNSDASVVNALRHKSLHARERERRLENYWMTHVWGKCLWAYKTNRSQPRPPIRVHSRLRLPRHPYRR